MTGGAQFAVVIVSFNTRDLLLQSVASAIESTGGAAVELVVVDNNSTDGSLEAVQSRFPRVIAISNDSNRGFGAACNQGIRATQAPFILLLNSDARLTAQGFRALCDCMLEIGLCGAAGCRLVDAQGVGALSTRNFLTPFNQALELAGITGLIALRGLRRTHRPRFDETLRDCSVDWIDGACLMLRRTALDDAGLFDERFFMYSEDEDLCFRLKQRGWSICTSAAGEAVHQGGASAEHNKAEMLRQFYLSQMMFLSKHRGATSVFAYRVSMKTVLTLKFLMAGLLGAEARRNKLREQLSALKRAISSRGDQRT